MDKRKFIAVDPASVGSDYVAYVVVEIGENGEFYISDDTRLKNAAVQKLVTLAAIDDLSDMSDSQLIDFWYKLHTDRLYEPKSGTRSIAVYHELETRGYQYTTEGWKLLEPTNKRRFLRRFKNGVTIYAPRSAESSFPMIVIDKEFKFDFFLQRESPFGLYIRLPFLWLRWGSA